MATATALMPPYGTVLGITTAMAIMILGIIPPGTVAGMTLGTILGITLLGMVIILTVMVGMATATVGYTRAIPLPSVIIMVGMPIT